MDKRVNFMRMFVIFILQIAFFGAAQAWSPNLLDAPLDQIRPKQDVSCELYSPRPSQSQEESSEEEEEEPDCE